MTSLVEARADDAGGLRALSSVLERELRALGAGPRPVAFACIGSDRSTGDALGPLAGELLRRRGCAEHAVVGTLERPLHALNMVERLAPLAALRPRPVVVAVDAALGPLGGIGSLAVSRGGMVPGEGIGKDLPPIGELSVTATVNVRTGGLDAQVLHSTRLWLVHQLAEELAAVCWGALLGVRPADALAAAGRGRRASDREFGASRLPA